jgi:hypothetical protein
MKVLGSAIANRQELAEEVVNPSQVDDQNRVSNPAARK